MTKIKFKLEAGAILPHRSSVDDAGLDIHCNMDVVIPPQTRLLVNTGVVLADAPKGMYLRVAPRSKLANKLGLDVLAGVVDTNYRGEIGVILYNTTCHTVTLADGSAIAQLIPERIMHVECEEVRAVTKSSRGAAGIHDTELRL